MNKDLLHAIFMACRFNKFGLGQLDGQLGHTLQDF
jgi:hypothetical protein